MKIFLIILFIILIITGCNKENTSYITTKNETKIKKEAEIINKEIKEEKELNYFYLSKDGNGNQLFFNNNELIYKSDGKLSYNELPSYSKDYFFSESGIYHISRGSDKCVDIDCKEYEYHNSIYKNGEKIIDSGKKFLIKQIEHINEGNIYYKTVKLPKNWTRNILTKKENYECNLANFAGAILRVVGILKLL